MYKYTIYLLPANGRIKLVFFFLLKHFQNIFLKHNIPQIEELIIKQWK